MDSVFLRQTARLLGPAILVLAGVAGCGDAEPVDGIAFEDVTVIDAERGIRTGQRVVVIGERIAAVGPMSEGAPVVTHTVDAAGRYLIPGLWDMHVHFLYDAVLTDEMAALFVEHGITSVRDTGGDLERLVALRDALETGAAPAPRVFLSGPLLDGRHVVYDGGDPGRPELGTAVPGVAAAERQVAALQAAGADFIKIYELVMPAVFDALVDAARARDLPVAAHVPLMMTADQAGPLVDSMEHLRNVELACAANFEELLAARQARITAFEDGRGYDLRSAIHAAQRIPAIEAYDTARCAEVLSTLTDTIQVPTLRLNAFSLARPFERADWNDALARLPESVTARWSEQLADRLQGDTTFAEWSVFVTGLMRDQGVPIGAGTDTPIGLAVPGYSLHTELALLVESGLTPLEALEAATLIPAHFFDLQDELGTVAAGKVADLVLLDADPLADIANTRRVAGVMIGGRWLPGAEPP